MMFGYRGCTHVIAVGGMVPRGDGSRFQLRRWGHRGRQVRGERHRLVEMDVHHLKRIIGGRRIGKVDRRRLSARGLRVVVGKAGRTELRGRRRRAPRPQPILHPVWLRRRNPIEMRRQAGMDAYLLRGQARSTPHEFERVHARGRMGQWKRFGQTGRDYPFGFDRVQRFGPRHQSAFEGKRSRRLRRVARLWPQFPRVTARLSGHQTVGRVLVPDVRAFLRRDLLIGVPPPEMLGEGGLATEAVQVINGTGLQPDEDVDPAYAFPHSGISHIYGLLPL